MVGEKEMVCCIRAYYFVAGIICTYILRLLYVRKTKYSLEIFRVKLNLHKILSYVFCVRKYWYFQKVMVVIVNALSTLHVTLR